MGFWQQWWPTLCLKCWIFLHPLPNIPLCADHTVLVHLTRKLSLVSHLVAKKLLKGESILFYLLPPGRSIQGMTGLYVAWNLQGP